MRNTWLLLMAICVALALLAGPPPGYGDTEADRLFHDGVANYLRGDLAAAQAALEAALRQSPTHENARNLLDEVSAERRRTAPAAVLPAAGAPVTLPVNPAPVYAPPAYPAPVYNGPVYRASARGAGMSEGLVTLGPVAASAPTAVMVPPQALAPMLTERLVLRGEAVPAGVKALTAVEVYNEGNALKIRLTVAGTIDIMEAKSYQPPQIMVDLLGCKDALPSRALTAEAGALVRVRHQRLRTEPVEVTRVTLELNRLVPYTVERVPGGVVITIPGTTGLVAPLALGEPPYFRPNASGVQPLTSYRVQSQWLRIIGGERQLGTAGTLLPRPMLMQVTDAAGVPQANVPVWLTVTEGNGFFRGANGEKNESVRVVTDAQGQAQVEGYFLSTVAGENVITASLTEGGSGVNFLHTSGSGEAADIVKIHGDEQEGLVASETGQPLVVEVRDRYGNPVMGQRVIFTVLYNDGTADVNPDRWGTQSVVVTDEHGRARLDKFKLGTRRGRNLVRASILTSGGAAARGGLLISAGGDDHVMIENNGEAVRTQAVQDHVSIFVQELLRDLPGSMNVDEIQVFSLGDVPANALRERVAEIFRGSDGVKFYADGDAVYVGPGVGGNIEELERKLQSLSPRPLMRRTVRSTVFTEYGRPQLISVDFRDASVADVVRTLAEIAGWNVVFPVGGDPIYSKNVTIHLVEVPAKDVLDNILLQCGYARIESNGIIRIVPKAEAMNNEVRIVTGNELDRFEGEEDEFINAFIPVRVRNPSELAALVGDMVDAGGKIGFDDESEYLMVTDRVANVRRIMEVVKLLDNKMVTINENMVVRLVTLKYADGQVLATTLSNIYPILIAAGRPNEQVNTSMVSAFSAIPYSNGTVNNRLLLLIPKQAVDRVMEIIEQLDSSPSATDEMVVKVVTLLRADGTKVAAILRQVYPTLTGSSATSNFLVQEFGTGVVNDRLLLIYPKSVGEQLLQLISQLDTGETSNMVPLVLSVNRVAPLEMVAILQVMYPNLKMGATSNGAALVAIVPKDQVDEIRAVVAQIDQNMTDIVDGSMQREVIRMQYLKPNDAVTILSSAFPGARIFALGNMQPVVSWTQNPSTGNMVQGPAGSVYQGLYGVLVIANQLDVELMKKTIAAMDLSPFPQGFTMTIYRPKYQTGTQLTEWAKTMMGGVTGQGQVIPDDYTKRLLIWDTAENAQILMDFFARMDVPPSEGIITQSVMLGNITAAEMSTVLQSLYRGGAFIPSTSAGRNLLFIQMPREVMPQVMQTINELDQMTVGETIAVVPLSADVTVTDIEADLKLLFPNLNILSSEWPAPSLIIAGDVSSVEKAKIVVRQLDQPLITRTFRVTYGEATSIANLLTTFLTTKGKAQADGRTNSLIITDVTSNMARIQRVILDLDRNVTAEGEGGTRVFFLKNAQAADLVTVLANVVQPTRGTNDLQVLLGTLSADARTNSILVNSTPANMPLIANLINKLDERTPQVLIEATILEYSLQDDENMGFVWNFSDRFGGFNYSSGFDGSVGGPFSLTLTKGQLSVVMDALSQTQRSNVLSSPRLLTLNNKAANITIGTNRQQQESRTDPNTGAVTTSFVTKSADLVVDVTPQIGSDRSVMLEFALDLEQFIPTTDPAELPTNTRKLTNSIIVADGQTLVIGGIITDQENLSRSGVLGLMDIPVIGNIFSSRRDGKQKVELMIFLTPKVIANAAEGDIATRAMAQEAQVLTPLPVNVNVASFDEIIRLPGLKGQDDPQRAGLLANRIIKHREMYGPYQSLEELKFVPGIDDRTFEAIVYRLKYQIEVNQASLEDLRAIKGVTLPIAQGIIKYRNERGLFTDYDTVKRVFVQLGYPAESYDIYLGDIMYIGNVVRLERADAVAPAPAAPVLPPVTTRPNTGLPPLTMPPITVRPNTGLPPVTAPPVTAPPVTAPPVTAPPATTGLLNLNTATVEQLRGVGFDEMAAKLAVAYRTRNGAYASVEDLKKVAGIPLEMYNRAKDKLTVVGAPPVEDNGIMLMPSVPATTPQGTVTAEEDNGLLMMPNLPPSGGVGGGAVPRLNLNTATAEQLSRLPGIDLLKAKMVIAYRYTYGDFGNITQARNVPYLTAEDVATLTQYAEIR